MPQVGIVLAAHCVKLFIELSQHRSGLVVEPATLHKNWQEPNTFIEL